MFERILNWSKAHEKLAAAALFVAITAVVLMPMLLGYVAAPLQNLNNKYGWSEVSSTNGQPIKVTSDVADQILPYRAETLRIWKEGVIPIWSNNNFTGTAWVANVQSAVFWPINIVGLATNVFVLQNCIVFVALFGCMYFLYLYLRELKLSAWASITASLCFGLSHYMIGWLEWGSIPSVLMCLPLLLYLSHRYLDSRKRWYLIAFTLVQAVQFLAGHFNFSLYVFLVSNVYVLWLAVVYKSRHVFWLWGGSVFAVMLAAIQIIPSSEANQLAIRPEVPLTGLGSTSLTKYTLVQSVLPLLHGNVIHDLYSFRSAYIETALFVGTLGFGWILASLARLRSKVNKVVMFYWLLFVGLFVMYGFPTIYWLAARPVFPLRKLPQVRLSALIVFAGCVLIGFGLDVVRNFLRKLKPVQPLKWLLAGLCSLVVGAMFVSLPIYQKLFSLAMGISRLHHVPYLQQGVIGGVLIRSTMLTVLVTVFLLCAYTYYKKPYFLILLTLSITAELFVFAHYYLSFAQPNDFYAKNPIFEQVSGSDYNNSRTEFYKAPAGGWDATPLYYGVPRLAGYDSLYPENIYNFIKAMNYPNPTPDYNPLMLRNIDKPNSLRVAGVNYVISAEQLGNYHKLAEANSLKLYQINDALPMMYLARSVVATSTEDQLSHIRNDSIKPGVAMANAVSIDNLSTTGLGTASFKPGVITTSVNSDKPSFIVLNQTYQEGWKLYINHNQAPIIQTNYLFMGAELSPGNNQIEFRYEPTSVKLGLLLSTIGIGLITALIIWPKKPKQQ